MKNKDFIIIAHRGESFDAPENTLASINLAWERNADAVEIDIQLTKDKKIVVIHDKSTLRTGGKMKRIATSTYNELHQINVGKLKGAKWKNEKIPLLNEVIDTIPANKILFIELKSNADIINPLKKLISDKKSKPDQIKFIGFNYKTMSLTKKLLPKFESYWIIEGKNYKKNSNLSTVTSKCRKVKLDGIDVQERKYLDEKVINSAHNSDLKIYTWTIDDPNRAKQLRLAGIDGITTNRAKWLKQQLMIF